MGECGRKGSGVQSTEQREVVRQYHKAQVVHRWVSEMGEGWKVLIWMGYQERGQLSCLVQEALRWWYGGWWWLISLMNDVRVEKSEGLWIGVMGSELQWKMDMQNYMKRSEGKLNGFWSTLAKVVKWMKLTQWISQNHRSECCPGWSQGSNELGKFFGVEMGVGQWFRDQHQVQLIWEECGSF